jgi:hypothetical protein
MRSHFRLTLHTQRHAPTLRFRFADLNVVTITEHEINGHHSRRKLGRVDLIDFCLVYSAFVR